MKKLAKLASIVLSAAMVLGSLSACSPAEKSDAIKIGGIGPLTGNAAIYGRAAKNGATIAVEEVNALGGIQFDLRYEDDENDAEKAINAYNNLKETGVCKFLLAV